MDGRGLEVFERTHLNVRAAYEVQSIVIAGSLIVSWLRSDADAFSRSHRVNDDESPELVDEWFGFFCQDLQCHKLYMGKGLKERQLTYHRYS